MTGDTRSAVRPSPDFGDELLLLDPAVGVTGQGLLAERFLERLFDAMPTAVSVLDPRTCRVVRVNAAFERLVGYSLGEMVGLEPPFPWWTDAPVDFYTDAWASPEGTRVETLFRRKDGTPVPVEIVRFWVRDLDGVPHAAVALITDLSERRHFEQQLLVSDRLATIGELAAGVAHEINNPLFAILGLVEFLLKDAEPGTKVHHRLELIQQTGLEIKEIVRALLDFARERSDEHSVVSLEWVVANTVELVRRTSAAKQVEIVERYGDAHSLVSASASQLKQIFVNLITNAQQAMPDGGTIVISTEADGDWVQVTVADDGPGIPEELHQRIFEPFFTTKRPTGGTGLGLAVSLGIAQMHGGDLHARSGPGSGAQLVLRLPVHREAAAA
jgi:PAS domain S-box-containing protein